jgi:hypothetical protein
MTYEQKKYTLELESLIETKRFFIARMEYDAQRYGEWQCDWPNAVKETDDEINKLLGFMAQHVVGTPPATN